MTLSNLPRIAIIHPEAGVSSNGGSQLSALELTRHLRPYCQVELLCSANNIEAMGDDAHQFVTRLPAIPRGRIKPWLQHPVAGPLLRPFSHNPEIFFELLTSFIPYFLYLIRHPFDLLYPNNGYAGLMLATRVRALNGVPLLYTERAGLLANGKILRKDLAYKPDHLVVFDQHTQDKVNQWRPQQACSVLPNGVDLSRFASEGERLNLGLPGKVVLCVGSLARSNHKRIELTIAAMATLTKFTDCSLLICGDGPDKAYFADLAAQQLAPQRYRIASFGFEQMPQVYRSCDLFTLASANEPFGRVYLEALASGLPVVAPDDAMRRSILAEAGRFCDVSDIEAYANCLAAALPLKQQTDWQQLAKQQAERFSWHNIARQYASVIYQMTGHQHHLQQRHSA
ncbi:glycosyltransferase [Neptunicella marina]|uniref:Glycosyltransferase n=1 Tax=Neptunicella marina TaxID=2125989 RepID=A0A8J6IW11_9ALTE|nr:glycosyltransferase [Neptunicella marina]MBC3767641.1 glycosyltransferase [Neptunicella marina]